MYCYKARCFTFPTGLRFWVIVFHWFNYLIVFKRFGIEIPILPYSASSSQGRIQRGFEEFTQPRSVPIPIPIPYDLKCHFHGKFWINVINLGNRINPKYSHPLIFTLYIRPFYYLWMCVKLLGEWKTVYTLIRGRVSQSSICGQCVFISNLLGAFLYIVIQQRCFTFLIEFPF